MAKKQMDPGPKKKKVMPTSVQKSKGPSVGSGNPFAGPSKPRKSAYSEAAQKRMKAEAEGTFRPIYTSASMTRVLPEMTGKLTVKAPVKKPSIKKKK